MHRSSNGNTRTLRAVMITTVFLGPFTGMAQPPSRPPGGAGPGGSGSGITCPKIGEAQFSGSPAYMGQGPRAAPLRGSVGCVDLEVLAKRPTADVGGQARDANNIYGPMEAGFTNAQPGAACLGSFELPGGVDTNLAEAVMDVACKQNTPGSGGIEPLLDYCGGHATPFHYHERASCLYTADPATLHSTRVGTALDGNGIYGHNIASGCEPTDLDWCGGRYGVTPDSNGNVVYYYVITNRAPFSLGCFGPVTTQAQCRALYPECDGVTVQLTTEHGTDAYDLDCPCFDPVTGSNVPGATMKPRFLGPTGFEQFECPQCTPEQRAEIAAQYGSGRCGAATPAPTPPVMAVPPTSTPTSPPAANTPGTDPGPAARNGYSLRLALRASLRNFPHQGFVDAVRAVLGGGGPSGTSQGARRYGRSVVNYLCPASVCAANGRCNRPACTAVDNVDNASGGNGTAPHRNVEALQQTGGGDEEVVYVDFSLVDENGNDVDPAGYDDSARLLNIDMSRCWANDPCNLGTVNPVGPALVVPPGGGPPPSPPPRTPAPVADDDGLGAGIIILVIVVCLAVVICIGVALTKGCRKTQEESAAAEAKGVMRSDAAIATEVAPGGSAKTLDDTDAQEMSDPHRTRDGGGRHRRRRDDSMSSDGDVVARDVYAVGESVRVLYNDSQWHPARIHSRQPDGRYAVVWDDHSFSSDVPVEKIRGHRSRGGGEPRASHSRSGSSAPSAFAVGDRVRVLYVDNAWYPATVRATSPDGTYAVLWDDGQYSEGVPIRQMRVAA